MTTATDMARSIDAAARSIHQKRTRDEVLRTIVEVACSSVPGFDHASITTRARDGKAQTRTSSNDLALSLDEVQYDLDEGPCLDAVREHDCVVAPVLRHDQRWPAYVPHAVSRGVRAQLSIQLAVDDAGTLGGLNLYSTTSEDVSDNAIALARLFATHSSVALGHAHERQGLTEALQTRKVIGQAIGMIMERYGINEDRAFGFLVRASSHQNIKLRAIAQELVDQGNNGETPSPR